MSVFCVRTTLSSTRYGVLKHYVMFNLFSNFLLFSIITSRIHTVACLKFILLLKKNKLLLQVCLAS